MNIHGIMQTWKYVGRIFPSNSILDPVSTPRNALYDRRTEVSKMETVNYILIWRHASWENLSRAHTSDSLSFAVTKGDSLFRSFVSRSFFTYRFDYPCKLFSWMGEEKKKGWLNDLNNCFST